MELKVVKFGKKNLHICVKPSDGFFEGQIIKVPKPNENEGITEKKVIEIVDKRIEKLRGEY